jgi:hypothetical protein
VVGGGDDGVVQSVRMVRACLLQLNRTPHMKSQFASLIRHLLTCLAGIGGFLLEAGLIDSTQVAQANEAGAALVDPMAILCGLAAAGLARVAIGCLGKIFPALAAKISGASGGALPLWLLVMTAGALVMGCLPSCTPNGTGLDWTALKSIPIKSCIVTEQGKICYSSKSGLEVEVDARSGK